MCEDQGANQVCQKTVQRSNLSFTLPLRMFLAWPLAPESAYLHMPGPRSRPVHGSSVLGPWLWPWILLTDIPALPAQPLTTESVWPRVRATVVDEPEYQALTPSRRRELFGVVMQSVVEAASSLTSVSSLSSVDANDLVTPTVDINRIETLRREQVWMCGHANARCT